MTAPKLTGDWRRLIARALEQGWQLERTTSHAYVLRTQNGNLVSVAPHRGADHAWRSALGRLRRAGLRL
jgi:hypothetical protein